MLAVLIEIIVWARGLVAALGVFALRIFSTGYIAHLLIGLGFGVVSYTGVDVIGTSLVSLMASNWSALPSSVLQLASLAGVPQALNLIFSAHISGIAFLTSMGIWKRFRYTGS